MGVHIPAPCGCPSLLVGVLFVHWVLTLPREAMMSPSSCPEGPPSAQALPSHGEEPRGLKEDERLLKQNPCPPGCSSLSHCHLLLPRALTLPRNCAQFVLCKMNWQVKLSSAWPLGPQEPPRHLECRLSGPHSEFPCTILGLSSAPERLFCFFVLSYWGLNPGGAFALSCTSSPLWFLF